VIEREITHIDTKVESTNSDTNGRQEYTHMGKLDPRANGILRKRRRKEERLENAAVGWYGNFTTPGFDRCTLTQPLYARCFRSRLPRRAGETDPRAAHPSEHASDVCCYSCLLYV
jgi:hypothetical protein